MIAYSVYFNDTYENLENKYNENKSIIVAYSVYFNDTYENLAYFLKKKKKDLGVKKDLDKFVFKKNPEKTTYYVRLD